MLMDLGLIKETTPGAKWKRLFDGMWPAYRTWFLCEGESARTDLASCRELLSAHMPELVPTFDRLCALSGGDELAARFLSMVDPPPYLAGCSQVAWTEGDAALIRNYDFSPRYFEGVLFRTDWVRPVLGFSDCMWGLVDGMNSDGLAACLSFGGRKVRGKGFGIPLVVRYVLETCANVREACEQLVSIPLHMAYSVTLVDASGTHATVHLSPDRDPVVTEDPVCTNHQLSPEWPEHATYTQTLERKTLLEAQLVRPELERDTLINLFLESPLYREQFQNGFGTLYTAVYYPGRGDLELRWPEQSIRVNLMRFDEQNLTINLPSTVTTPERQSENDPFRSLVRDDKPVRRPSEFGNLI